MGASNKVILCSHDTIHQPSANTGANPRPDHLKSDRKSCRFCWSQPKMDRCIILWLWGTWKVNSSALKHSVWRQQPKKCPNPPNSLSNALLMSRLQNLAAGAAKKSNCGLFETTLRAVLFNPLITDLFLGAKDSGKLFSSVALLFNDFRRLESQSPLTRANDYDSVHSYHGVHTKCPKIFLWNKMHRRQDWCKKIRRNQNL